MDNRLLFEFVLHVNTLARLKLDNASVQVLLPSWELVSPKQDGDFLFFLFFFIMWQSKVSFSTF